MSPPDPLFVHCIGAGSTALGKPCALCAASFRTGDRITLAVRSDRPARAVGVHTACLLPVPPVP
jgi:hypothetical protein